MTPTGLRITDGQTMYIHELIVHFYYRQFLFSFQVTNIHVVVTDTSSKDDTSAPKSIQVTFNFCLYLIE